MIPSMANGFLATLVVLASGYVLYAAPLSRLWWSRVAGTVLYFRIGATGIALLFVCYAAMHAIEKFYRLPLGWEAKDALLITFPLAAVLWIADEARVWLRSRMNPEWEYNLNLRSLHGKGLDQFVHKSIHHNEMIMVTLKNNKVYAGWPIQAPNNDDNQWLRIVPQWSGHQDQNSNIVVDTNYAKTMGSNPSDSMHILIAVEEIITVHPFDAKVFKEFNAEN